MAANTATLLDQALGAKDRATQREAFVELLCSEAWRQVLAPHVLSRQGFEGSDGVEPDWRTFEQAAPHIGADEDKVQHLLELLGSRFAGELLVAVARHVGTPMVEQLLPHLRTAEEPRATLLLFVLNEADPKWVLRTEAAPAIRKHLKGEDIGRMSLMVWLARAGNLGKFSDLVEKHPPTAVEEWSAAGRAQIVSDSLISRAMAILPHHPGPLLYLLRLDPLPEEVVPRMMASARGDWIATALELAVADSLKSKSLVPLAELGVRLGGRSLAAANAWIGASKLSRVLLGLLAEQMERDDSGNGRVSEMLWIRRRAPSADRALERGRRGEKVDVLDAAALVRQLRGDKLVELVQEIVETPRENMIAPVLHSLCAVHGEAAAKLLELGYDTNPAVANRANELRAAWTDVFWPDAPQEG